MITANVSQYTILLHQQQQKELVVVTVKKRKKCACCGSIISVGSRVCGLGEKTKQHGILQYYTVNTFYCNNCVPNSDVSTKRLSAMGKNLPHYALPNNHKTIVQHYNHKEVDFQTKTDKPTDGVLGKSFSQQKISSVLLHPNNVFSEEAVSEGLLHEKNYQTKPLSKMEVIC